jgi:hypothetical protein
MLTPLSQIFLPDLFELSKASKLSIVLDQVSSGSWIFEFQWSMLYGFEIVVLSQSAWGYLCVDAGQAS